MKNKIVLYAKTVGELMEAYNIAMLENNRLREELEELRETYNIILIENNKLRKKLEESKKRVIDLEKCIELSLEADGIIEKVKEVKNK